MPNALPTSPVPIIDIGVNLTNKAFLDDLDNVIEHARSAGIQHLLITGTNEQESIRAIELSKQNPLYLSNTVGVHPHDAKHWGTDSYNNLKALSMKATVKAIGECGLDFNRMFSSKDEQILAFEKQIELAIECQLPLFLHERDAHKEQLEILKHYRDHFPGGVAHCFTGSKEQAFNYLDIDLHIGITGWICDERRGYHLHDFVGDIPLNRLLLETDAPYLMPRVKPKPALKSSRRNEPCTLPYVLFEIEKHSSYCVEQLGTATTANAISLFKLEIN